MEPISAPCDHGQLKACLRGSGDAHAADWEGEAQAGPGQAGQVAVDSFALGCRTVLTD
jgi:hypothetical protein